MTLTPKSHGRPYPEVDARELPAGRPAEPDPIQRRQDGTVADSASAKELGRRGGAKKAQRSAVYAQFATYLGHLQMRGVSMPTLKAHVDDAEAFYKDHVAELARDVGGGICPAAACSIVRLASWQRAYSTAFFELAATGWFFVEAPSELKPGARPAVNTALLLAASQLATASRQNLLAAHALCASHAESREKARVHGTAGQLPAWLVEVDDDDNTKGSKT